MTTLDVIDLLFLLLHEIKRLRLVVVVVMILHYNPRVISLRYVEKLPKICASTENDHLKMYFPLNSIFQQSPCDRLLQSNKRNIQQKTRLR